MSLNATDAESLEARFPLITSHLSRQELAALAAMLEVHQIAAGETLIRENESADTLYLLVEGQLHVGIGVDGKPRPVGLLEPGAIVGEVALMDPGAASATVVAEGAAVLYALRHEALDELSRREPQIAAAILRAVCHVLTDRLRAADSRISALIAAFDEGTVEKAEEPEHHGLMDWFRVRFGSARRQP